MGSRRRLKSACPCLVSLLANLERIVVLGHGTLQLYILRYHLIRHVARRHHEVTPCPKVPTPELLADPTKVSHQTIRRPPLDQLHHSTRRQIRRHTQQQVDVLRPYMALQYFYVVPRTDLPNEIPETNRNVPSQGRLAVLRDKYEVIV